MLDDRTPVPSPGRRGDYPQRYWPWLDDTAPDERDVDAVLLTTAAAEFANAARAAAEVGPLVAVTHAFVIGWLVRAAWTRRSHAGSD
ncbi:MAG: hypothetical protein H0V92_12185 [Pseudonocardiales bacterium]|nr:hypothetical protein [Pseudonocardiales bacterium]